MTFDGRESSKYSGKPFELFLFQTQSQQWRMTGADETKSYLSNNYPPEVINHSEPSQGQELKSGDLTVTIPRDHEIASLFYAYTPATPLWLTIYRAHDGEPESETVVYWTGKVASAKFTEGCDLTCVPEQDALKKHVPVVRHSQQCNRILYAPGCNVNPASFRIVATVASVDAEQIVSADFGSQPDGWLNAGYLEWGAQRRMILAHTGDNITLIAGVPDLAAGDTVSVFAGCKRDYNGDCINKFANGDRFLGFQWVPIKNPFGGGLA